MKGIKIAITSIGLTAAFLFIFSLFLPSTYRVAGVTVIDAGIDEVYPYILDLQNWTDWNEWNTRKDRSASYVYSGSIYGEGSVMSWKGKYIKNGKLILKKFKAGDYLTYTLYTDSKPSHGKIIFEEINDFTRISWTHTFDTGWEPWNKLEAYFLDEYKGPDIETALSRLKKLIENLDTTVSV